MFILLLLADLVLTHAWENTVELGINFIDSKGQHRHEFICLPTQLPNVYSAQDYIYSSLQSVGYVGASSADIDAVHEAMENRMSLGRQHAEQYKFSPHHVTPALNAPTTYRFDERHSDKTSEALIFHVQMAIYNARRGLSKLTKHQHSLYMLHNMTGMSSTSGRHLLNNICSAMETRYLEIGTWHGATLVSSIAGNENNIAAVTAIDWWAWDDPVALTQTLNPTPFSLDKHKIVFGPSELAYRMTVHNILTYTDIGSKVGLIRSDCFKVNTEELLSNNGGKKYNVYFYDAEHEVIDQYMAFTYFNSVLSDLFVAIVDDWNNPNVAEGTSKAFDELQYKVLYGEVLGGGIENHENLKDDLSPWHNGIYVAVVEKKK